MRKKLSKAEAKRLATEAAKHHEEPDPLPAPLQAKLDRYQPLGVEAAVWGQIRAAHRAVMVRSRIEGEASFTGRCRDLAAYLAWRHETGLGVGLDEAMTFAALDDYHRRGDRHGVNDTNWDNRYSRLRTLARRANPGLDAPTPAATVGYQAIRPPYDEREHLVIERLARRQRNPTTRRQLCAIVGLCAGAGLAPPDLRHLCAHHIDDRGDEGIRVEVPGDPGRIVWVRRRHEDLVRIGVQGLAPKALVIGREHSRRNVTTSVLASAELLGDVPDIDARRLRSTWLAWLLTQPVSLYTALAAAGLKTARTLQDLIPYLEVTDLDARDLRGAPTDEEDDS